MIEYAVELGHEVVAVTDHEAVCNAVKVEKIYKKIKKNNPDFKVILGNEIYLCRNGLNASNFNREYDRYYHFVLLAKDAIGHKQIREISTRAWRRSYMARGMRRVPTYYQDLIDIIGENRGHVIGTTACLGGVLNKADNEIKTKFLKFLIQFIIDIPFLYNSYISSFAFLYAFCILFLCITFKLLYEQFFNHEYILKRAENLWQRDFKISGKRGTIYTKDEEVLAINMPSTSVVVVPLMIKDYEKTANILSDILECDKEQLLEKIKKRVSTQKLQPEGRNIDDEQRKKIIEANLEGVILVEDSKRYYPNGNYLSQVLGFSGIDHQGLSGIELEYDEYLKAKNGELKIAFDAKGNLLNLNQEVIHSGYGNILVKEGSRGNDIVLTIDSKIQNIVEREMEKMVLKYEPASALALAMDPNTGAILSMVSKPDFDPNSYEDYSVEVLNRNLPIWMSFEPGSTFKSVTFASALEENLFDMYKDTFYDRGYVMIGGARIKSWRAGGHGEQTFLQVLENSSNPGFVEIGSRLGKKRLYNYINEFGFGKKTGIDLPGESSGIMFSYDAIGPLEAATIAFGQGLSVTPIQLVRAFSAIVNGGNLYQPYIVDNISNPLTKEIIYKKYPKFSLKIKEKPTIRGLFQCKN